MKVAIRAIAAAAALLVTLTGCASANPANAATVNGRAITESHVDEVNTVVATKLNGDPRQYRFAVLAALVQGRVAREVAVAQGITLSDADRAAFVESDASLTALAAEPLGKEIAYDIADAELVHTKLGGAAFIEAAQKVAVVVNPRYGAWSAEAVTLTGKSGSLSQPVPSALATR